MTCGVHWCLFSCLFALASRVESSTGIIPNATFESTGDISPKQHNGFIFACLALILALYVLGTVLSPSHDPAEPPLIRPRIPFVGHLIGILTHGINYFAKVAEKVGKPVFTLPILTGKVYVITSPDLVTACMRETRTMSFNPFIVEVFRRMAGLSTADMAITRHNMDSKGTSSYMSEMHRVEYASLSPGPALDKMYGSILNMTASSLESIQDNSVVDLYDTIRHIAAQAMFHSVYGPANPFAINPELVDDFFLFERNVKWLLLDICPWLLAPRAYRARARLTQGFLTYYQTSAHQQASATVTTRFAVAKKYQQPQTTIASFDVGLCLGLLSNTIPTMFWTLTHILASPTLYHRILTETTHLVHHNPNTNTTTINLTSEKHVRQSCPLLTSTFHETLRVISAPLSSGRSLLADTLLSPSHSSPQSPSPSYLLKSGATVQIPSSALHHPQSSHADSSSPWLDHHRFNPDRFLHFPAKTAAEPERYLNGSFRAFGGGSVLCPGRKLAFVEVLGLVVGWCHLFEFGDEVRVPPMETSKVALAVAKPVDHPDQRVRVGVKWKGGRKKKVVIRIGGEG